MKTTFYSILSLLIIISLSGFRSFSGQGQISNSLDLEIEQLSDSYSTLEDEIEKDISNLEKDIAIDGQIERGNYTHIGFKLRVPVKGKLVDVNIGFKRITTPETVSSREERQRIRNDYNYNLDLTRERMKEEKIYRRDLIAQKRMAYREIRRLEREFKKNEGADEEFKKYFLSSLAEERVTLRTINTEMIASRKQGRQHRADYIALSERKENVIVG